MDFSTTTKGKPLLRYEGHEYILKRRNLDGSKVWRCILARKYKCPSTLLVHDDIIREPGRHCHETDLVRSKAKEVAVGLKASVRNQPGVATRQIVARVLQNVPEEVMAVLPKKQTLMHAVQNERKALGGAVPNPHDRHFQVPAEYQELVLYDSGADDDDRILILGDRDLVTELGQSSLWFVDGTFDVAPEMYCQLYSFHCKIGSSYPACLYALLPNKEGETYNRLLDAFHNNVMPNSNPTRILTDFEQAVINAFHRFFPNAEVQGCYFHLNQCLVRKVQQLGLKRHFDNDMDYKLKVKSLAALSFVPPNDVQNIFNDLSVTFPDDDASFQLLGYFDANWVNGPGNRDPRYPIQLWNHHAAAAEGGPRTTNCCEGWHNSLNSHFLCKHPSVWKLMDGLKEDIRLNRLVLVHAQTGVVENQPKKYVILAQRVRDAVNGYGAQQDKLRYLRRLAALQ